MKRRKRKVQILSIIMFMIIILSACGNAEEPAEEVVADNGTAVVENEVEEPETVEVQGEEEGKEEEPEPEEIEEEPLAVVPYFEENELEFCDVLTITGKGVRIDINEPSVYEEVDSECVITDVSIEELEDETKRITIKYEVMGEIYDSTGRRFLQIILPNAIYCDLNTGEFQPFDGEILWDDGEEINYTIEWNGISYDIAQTKVLEWSKKMDWHSDGKNGYVTPATMYVTDTFIVPKDYDGMGMIIGMFTAEELYSGEYELFKDNQPSILEVLENREDARLYSVNEVCKLFSEDKVVTDDADANVNTGNSSAVSAKENTNNSNPKESTSPKQEQPVHTHSYSSSVTKNPTCSENGEKTFVCSCGSSYTEAIPASGHQWTTTTETISHPSTGHYETVTKKELYCNCGATFSSMDQLNAHTETHTEGDPGRGVRETSENVWIVDNDSWEETITINKCSVCGINQ